MLGGGQSESSYIQNPEQARTPRAGTTRTRSRVGTPTAAPVHQTENNTILVNTITHFSTTCSRGITLKSTEYGGWKPAGTSQHSPYLYGQSEMDKETCYGTAEDSLFSSARAACLCSKFIQETRPFRTHQYILIWPV